MDNVMWKVVVRMKWTELNFLFGTMEDAYTFAKTAVGSLYVEPGKSASVKVSASVEWIEPEELESETEA